MSVISTITSLLSALDPGIVRIVAELIKTIAESPEDQRQAIATRALKAAASRAAGDKAIEEALDRLKR